MVLCDKVSKSKFILLTLLDPFRCKDNYRLSTLINTPEVIEVESPPFDYPNTKNTVVSEITQDGYLFPDPRTQKYQIKSFS